jgi:hypothetical protein
MRGLGGAIKSGIKTFEKGGNFGDVAKAAAIGGLNAAIEGEDERAPLLADRRDLPEKEVVNKLYERKIGQKRRIKSKRR